MSTLATGVPWAAYACLASSMALVGGYVGLSKWLVAALPVCVLAMLRFAIAAVAMLPWLRPRPGEAALDGRSHGLLFMQSLLGNFLFSVCMLLGVQATSALAAGVVMSAIPATVAVLSWAFLRERLDMRLWLAMALAACGMATLAFARQATQSPAALDPTATAGATAAPWWGYALLMAATLCEAAYVVIGKRLVSTVSPQRVSAIINLWGLVLMLPLGLWQSQQVNFGAITQETWAALVFYALAASVVSVWLWMRGLQRVSAPRAGVFAVFLPVAAAAVGVMGLGERHTWAHGVALCFALAGVVCATWPRSRG